MMKKSAEKILRAKIEKKRTLILTSILVLLLIIGVSLLSVKHSNAGILQDIYNNLIKRGYLNNNYTNLQTDKPTIENKTTDNNNSKYTTTTTLRPIISYEDAIVSAVQKAAPAVVSIVITKDIPVITQCPYDPFYGMPEEFRRFFGDFPQFYTPCQKGTEKKEVGGGSGFIISSDGLIVTNKHVVEDTKAEYSVLTNDGKSYPAKVLARHPSLDLAIIKINASGLPTIKLGDSDKLKLGQTVMAIGNALGQFRNTVSKGIISGLARSITASSYSGHSETINNVIQTDAAINPGNSGGPLINIYGEVVGINVATVSGAQNIGFAIPINEAKKAIESVKKTGKIKVTYLGVRYITLNSSIAKTFNLDIDQGALLKGDGNNFAVEPNSPAASAGLREGDVILSVDGVEVDKNHTLGYLISQKSPGEKVTLKIWRNGKTFDVEVVLGERK